MSHRIVRLGTITIGLVLIILGVVCMIEMPMERLTRSRASLLILLLPAGAVLLLVGCLAHGPRATLRVHHVIEIAVGLLLILFCQFLAFASGPAALLALAGGTLLVIVGCFAWAYKLPPAVTFAAGVVLLALANTAGWYVPFYVPHPPAGPDDAAGLIIHLINMSLGIPGAVFIAASIVSVCRWLLSRTAG